MENTEFKVSSVFFYFNECPHVPQLAKFKLLSCPNGMFWNTLCFTQAVCRIKMYMFML